VPGRLKYELSRARQVLDENCSQDRTCVMHYRANFYSIGFDPSFSGSLRVPAGGVDAACAVIWICKAVHVPNRSCSCINGLPLVDLRAIARETNFRGGLMAFYN
jgi:hypothetical protein